MKILINEKLSQHRYLTPEGYLVCVDSVLARTGKQTYRRNEVFGDAEDDSEIEIDRTPEEVFSEETLASFENKPITVEHPDEDVNSENYKDYAVGFVRDIHRGRDNGQDVILGTLVIQDKKTIDEIKNGEHTDLSCGYDCDITEDEHPQQRNIRGNHVALCTQGRAGNARIVDTAINKETNEEMEIQEMDDKVKDEFFSDATQIKNIDKGYAILLRRVWDKRGEQAYAERWTDDIEEARRLKSTLERNDGFQFVIVQCHSTPKKVVDEETVLEMSEKYEKTPDDEFEEETGPDMEDADFNDALHTYEIKWMDIYAKSKGWADYKHHDKIKAETLRAALEKLGNSAGFGIGTNNMLIVNIHRDDGRTYTYTDRLANLLKKTDLADEDSVKDEFVLPDDSFIKSLEKQFVQNGFKIEQKIKGAKGYSYLLSVKNADMNINEAKKYSNRLDKISAYCKQNKYLTDKIENVREDGYFANFQIYGLYKRNDSVKDVIVAPDESVLRKYETELKRKAIIESKHKNFMKGYHYRIRLPKNNYSRRDLEAYTKELERISNEMKKLGWEATYYTELGKDGSIGAEVDIYGKSVKDSVKDKAAEYKKIKERLEKARKNKDKALLKTTGEVIMWAPTSRLSVPESWDLWDLYKEIKKELGV